MKNISRNKELSAKGIVNMSNFKWLCPHADKIDDSLIKLDNPLICITFKFRHSPEHYIGVLRRTLNGSYYITTNDIISGVAPGQFCIVYDKDFNKVLGVGEITLN